MSKISTAYTALIFEVNTLFPSKTRMHNANDILSNPALILRNSWGIIVNEASREDAEYCSLTLSRSLSIVLVKQFVSLNGKEDGFDAVNMAIMEDQQSLASLLHSPDELGVASDIDRIDVSPLSGITELTSGEEKFLTAQVDFNIIISESI